MTEENINLKNYDVTTVDETDFSALQRVNNILGELRVESNFGALPQLIAFGPCPPQRKLQVMSLGNDKRLVITGEYPDRQNLSVARILFQRGSPEDSDDALLMKSIHDNFHPDYTVYNLLPENKLDEVDAAGISNTHREFVLSIPRLVNCASTNLTFAQDPENSIPSRAKEFQWVRRRNPQLAYIDFRDKEQFADVFSRKYSGEEDAVDGRQSDEIEKFLKIWESQTGLAPTNDRRLLSLFWGKNLLMGGMVVDTTARAIVGLCCFTVHPARADMVVSIVNKVLRHKSYGHLGTFTKISEALHARTLYPQSEWLVIGGEGNRDRQGQTDHKIAHLSGGYEVKHVSVEAEADEEKLKQLGLTKNDRIGREDLLRSLWL